MNEYRVSQVRAAAYSVVVAIDVALVLAGVRPLRVLADSVPVVTLALVALAVVRFAPYRPWFRFAIPVADAVCIFVLLSSRFRSEGASTGLVGVTVLACGLFASTGGVRYDPWAAGWTSLLASALCLLLLGPYVSSMHAVYALSGLTGIAYLNYWISTQARRSMEGARSRELLRRFLPDVVVRRAFEAPETLLAEPRLAEATVMVTDLRGFTALSEALSPADVLRFLSEVQGGLADAVHAHGGVVDKFMGDGMLAVFGAHEEMPDHAPRALAAARAVRQTIARLNAQRGGKGEIRIGVGLHSGPVVAGVLGMKDRLELAVIGDTVNTASRLEAATKELGEDVVASEETVALAREAAVRPLGELTLRGRVKPTRVYGLV